jgi:hypothetical protein
MTTFALCGLTVGLSLMVFGFFKAGAHAHIR